MAYEISFFEALAHPVTATHHPQCMVEAVSDRIPARREGPTKAYQCA
jgi:hypothetical protein